MSASSKKKLRKEQNAAQLTAKQRQQQAEAKKLKNHTIIFVTAMVLVLAIALGVIGYRAVDKSGIVQKNTLAVTIGNHEINSVEMNYFFIDAINNMYNQWYSQYSSNTDLYVKYLYGLDTKKPLNEQVASTTTGETWADYFIGVALEDAKSSYAIYDLAMAENYKLPEAYQSELDSTITMNKQLAMIYGYKNVTEYLADRYGYGSTEESFNNYMTVTMTAYAYSRDYAAKLEYTDEDIRNHEKEHYVDYTAFGYASYTLNYSSFLEGGTKGEDGKITYSDAEKDAARQKMKETAESLAKATSVEELDKMIGALSINENSKDPVKSTKTERVMFTEIATEAITDWLKVEGRKVGDIGAIAKTTETKNDDGTTTSVTDTYYVLLVQDIDENKDLMANVRHLLVKFQGGTKDSNGNVTYSDAEKKAAEVKARGYLTEWAAGDATEESFIELVKKHTEDDGSKETGGLYEDIHKDSSYVENFLKWSINPEHKEGDADVIETEYGYHVMYRCADSKQTYRDYMITEALREADYTVWYEEVVDAVSVVKGDFSKMELDHIISMAS